MAATGSSLARGSLQRACIESAPFNQPPRSHIAKGTRETNYTKLFLHGRSFPYFSLALSHSLSSFSEEIPEYLRRPNKFLAVGTRARRGDQGEARRIVLQEARLVASRKLVIPSVIWTRLCTLSSGQVSRPGVGAKAEAPKAWGLAETFRLQPPAL